MRSPLPESTRDLPSTLVNLWLLPVAGGLGFALLTAMAFAPFGLWPLALLAPAPLIWVGWRAGRVQRPAPARGIIGRLRRTLRRPAVAAWLGTGLGVLPLWLYQEQWTIAISAFGYLPMCITLALLVALAPAMLAVARGRLGPGAIAWAGPLIWVGMEVFRGEVFFTGYPWLLASHPLIDAPGVTGLASVIGAYGVSVLTALPVCLALAPGKPLVRAARAGGAVVAIGLAGLGAAAMMPAAADRTVRIAVVQTNIPQDNKTIWTMEDRIRYLQRFLHLTEQAAAAEPDVIVWPETMFPGITLDPRSLEVARDAGWAAWLADALLETQRHLDIPMLVGAIALEGLRTDPFEYDAQYNSVYVVMGGAVAPQRYDKIHLTPFGEVMPYISNFPALQNALLNLAARGMSFALSAGASAHGLSVPIDGEPLQVATPICFEAASGPTTRRLAAEPRAHLLVNVTNDGWFGDFDPARHQAAQIARWRAVELATPMIRAANTGISIAFDARGRVVEGRFEAADGPRASGAGRIRTEGILVVDLAVGSARPTLFARLGWLTQWLLLAAAVGVVAAGALGWPGRGSRAAKGPVAGPAAGGTGPGHRTGPAEPTK